jgi:UDP-3-O-[3-hydroxymyristoyl] glucosamine N-acyltransferase
MIAKKYEILRDQTKDHFGRILYRIRRLNDGLIGGWIEKEENLSQEGKCFVYDEAKVFDNARIHGNAQLRNHARVFGEAQVYGDAWVFEQACVYGSAMVYGCHARVLGHAEVFECAHVYERASIVGRARIYGSAQVYGSTRIGAKVYGDAKVFGSSRVFGNAEVFGSAKVSGDAVIIGNANATVDAIFKQMPHHNITVTDHHISVGNEWHAFECWERNIERILKNRFFYADEDIALYRETIFALIAQRRAQGF